MSTKPEGVTATWRAEKRRWVGKYRAASGEWPQKVVPPEIARGPRDRAKALAWLAQFGENARPMGLRPKKRPSGLSLREGFDLWMKIRRDDERTSPATLRANRDLFKNVVMKEYAGREGSEPIALGEEDVVSLGTDYARLRRWVRAASKAHSPGRVRSAFSKLSLFFDDAIVEKWFRGENPCRNQSLARELPPMPTQQERGGVVELPLDISNSLLRSPAVPLQRRARYAVLLTEGLREGEVSGTTWERWSLDTEPLRVEVKLARRLLREEGERLGPLKRSTSVGTLPVHPAARAALREWRDDPENGISFLLGRATRPTDPVFPSSRARDAGSFARPDTADWLRYDLKVAGLPTTDAKGRNYTAQACRRTFGSALKRAKVDPLTRKRLMRHGARDVTEDYYTGEDWREEVEAVHSIGIEWVEGVAYEAPPAPPSFQELVMHYMAQHPNAEAPAIADALGIKRSTVSWVMSRVRTGRLVPPLVPSVVPVGTTNETNESESREPRVGLEPTTCALRKRDQDSPYGAAEARKNSGALPSEGQTNDYQYPNDSSTGTHSGGGTKLSAAPTGVRVELENGVAVAVEPSSGEPVGALVERVARDLRLKGIVARRIGAAGLQIGGSSKVAAGARRRSR